MANPGRRLPHPKGDEDLVKQQRPGDDCIKAQQLRWEFSGVKGPTFPGLQDRQELGQKKSLGHLYTEIVWVYD